ncbi:MAG: sulfurtransferase TusA [Buchnera aphidicola]|nr:sulfurtransferase TusA [Buchnera aphidicola]
MKKNYDTLNLIGLICPEPVMMIRKKIRDMKKNQLILILTDDPSTKRDIPKFCYFMNHELLKKETNKKPYSYLLKKGI